MARLHKGVGIFAAVVALVAGFEGVRTVAYSDPVGIPTICFGETRGVHLGDKATLEQCKTMLGDRLIEFSTNLDKCLVYHVPDKTYEAILSWAYNVGTGAACKSTLIKKANAGDIQGACDQLLAWNKAGGVVWPGLDTRRKAERALCLEGMSDA